jgi:peptidoglycan hydrolase-like protein with peptidoglycan-binding domain
MVPWRTGDYLSPDYDPNIVKKTMGAYYPATKYTAKAAVEAFGCNTSNRSPYPLTMDSGASPAGGGSGEGLARPNISRNLEQGAKGNDVTDLQNYLQRLGYFPQAQTATGYYGVITENAVRDYQCTVMNICSGDVVTNGWGRVGPKTRATF